MPDHTSPAAIPLDEAIRDIIQRARDAGISDEAIADAPGDAEDALREGVT
jgi:hypothetical protein